jgi:hypothetical protein
LQLSAIVIAAAAKGAVKFLKGVPGEVWAGLLVAAMIYGGVAYGQRFYQNAVLSSYNAGVSDTTTATKKAYEDQLKLNKIAHDAQLLESATTIEILIERLDASEKKAQTVHTITKEITRYVTKEADAACTIPVGFVRVHNATASADPIGYMAASGDTHDAEASGIALSEVAATVGDNYTECQLRGEVIDVWQSWYNRNKETFERTMKLQQPAIQ